MATSVRVLPAAEDGGSARNGVATRHLANRKIFVCLLKQYLPAMMLNILGLRIAGQISLRKTKPLKDEWVRYVTLNKSIKKKHADFKVGIMDSKHSQEIC